MSAIDRETEHEIIQHPLAIAAVKQKALRWQLLLLESRRQEGSAALLLTVLEGVRGQRQAMVPRSLRHC